MCYLLISANGVENKKLLNEKTGFFTNFSININVKNSDQIQLSPAY